MRALSIRPPWAYYIIYGVTYWITVQNADGSTQLEPSGKVILKDIENRDWPLPKWFELPQRIYVHVSKREDSIESVLDSTVINIGLPFMSILMSYDRKRPRGAIIGEVDIVDCVTESESLWFEGKYGFVLRNPKPCEPIPCRGKLGFFEPEFKEVTDG